MSTSDQAQAEAEELLDRLADELAASGLVEFVDFFMPHRQTRTSPPITSEIFGIRYDEEARGFRVYHRDMGAKRVLLEAGDWDEARALYVQKVTEESPFGRRKG